MLILDLGSGIKKYHEKLSGKNIIHLDINKNAFHIEINSDAHKLPFKDKSFDIVFCKHTLEHCISPLEVLKELKRICKKKIIIVIPNKDFHKHDIEDITHLYSWNYNTFYQLLKFVFNNIKVKTRFHFKNTDYIKECSRFKKYYYILRLRLFTTIYNENEIYGVIEL